MLLTAEGRLAAPCRPPSCARWLSCLCSCLPQQGKFAERNGLTPRQDRMLRVLQHGPLRMAQLGQRFGFKKVALTGLVDRARRAGSSTVKPCPPTAGRSRSWSPTPMSTHPRPPSPLTAFDLT